MKIALLIAGVLALLFVAIQFYVQMSQNDIESYPYTTVKSFGDFEIRKYEASLFSTVKLATNKYEQAASRGFSILAGYIFGGNNKKEKIAMTSPVAMTLEDSMTMMFMVPRKFDRDNLPVPNESTINFREEPAKVVAAIRFGGWANAEKIEKYKQKLIKILERENIAFTDRFYFLGYNLPYEVMNRKNEIIVEIKDGV